MPSRQFRCVRLCDRLTRREWLRIGGLSPLGLALPELLASRVSAGSTDRAVPQSFGRAKQCIICFLFGAPAHQDIWDLKPEAPADVRGEFKPIATSASGILVGEHIPRIAQQIHRCALVRSVQHPEHAHGGDALHAHRTPSSAAGDESAA